MVAATVIARLLPDRLLDKYFASFVQAPPVNR